MVLIGCKTDLRKDKEQLRKLRAAQLEPITYMQVRERPPSLLPPHPRTPPPLLPLLPYFTLILITLKCRLLAYRGLVGTETQGGDTVVKSHTANLQLRRDPVPVTLAPESEPLTTILFHLPHGMGGWA